MANGQSPSFNPLVFLAQEDRHIDQKEKPLPLSSFSKLKNI